VFPKDRDCSRTLLTSEMLAAWVNQGFSTLTPPM
jgi:hypothetical protein